jgi:hypothetical protein
MCIRDRGDTIIVEHGEQRLAFQAAVQGEEVAAE